MPIKTRFAPSPTGEFHIGSARTALYCWLFARKHQGIFILRIEDTDLERSTKESAQSILAAMDWLDLNYQEGPFYQTERFARYKEVLQQLLAEGKAYRCYCTKERLEKLREEQLAQKLKPRYDGHCRNLHLDISDQPYVIRFCNPPSGIVVFEDPVRGQLRFDNNELDDLIIARSDGSPTYNFTVVVDDWDMGITHVIRGDDHINNTPRQINILLALGASIPIYSHLPMILGSDGKRLSKRHGAVSVMQYREEGFLPQALINYLVRLGWSHGDQEIFSREEMTENFDLSQISKAPAIFNPEKLLWLNHHYIKTLDPANLVEELNWHMRRLSIDVTQGPDLLDLIPAQRERCKTLAELAEKSRYFYQYFANYDPQAAAKNLTSETVDALQILHSKLEQLTSWDKASLHTVVQDTATALQLPMGKVAQPLRVALIGNTISPPIDLTLELLGKDKVLQRIQRALGFIKSFPAGEVLK